MSKLLIVVDMLNDFVDEKGVLQFPQARKIVDYVVRKTQEFIDENQPTIFLMDSHKENDLEFNLFPKHAVKGTWGAGVIKQLVDLIEDYESVNFIPKTRYSGFYGTNLAEQLEEIDPEEVHVVGVCTSICVMDTVGGLANRDYKVVVHEKGVADFDDKAHEFSLARMKNLYGAKII